MLRMSLLILSLLAVPGRAWSSTILIVGDSLSASYGIPVEQGWVALLQQRLDSRYPGWRVINASVSGDTTRTGLKRLAPALDTHRPAILIVELGGNDVCNRDCVDPAHCIDPLYDDATWTAAVEAGLDAQVGVMPSLWDADALRAEFHGRTLPIVSAIVVTRPLSDDERRRIGATGRRIGRERTGNARVARYLWDMTVDGRPSEDYGWPSVFH